MTRNANTPRSSSTLPTIDVGALLGSLNPAQLRAVKHEPSIALQILAGPGSGKTKVLTSRIAQLILVHKIAPSSICAVTFTNKAANEMRERLTKLIGKERTTALQMGTFHSLCARFLRMHSRAVDLEDNFTICDADESKKLILALLKPYQDYLLEHDITLSEGSVASVISKAKAKGKTAAVFFKDTEETEKLKRRNRRAPGPQREPPKSSERILAEIYIGYEQILKDNNALDFDDLLIYGVRLFTNHEASVLWCRHILVDEFQDTNTMQYELMKAIAIRRCITIVGDPDQSIYGWRSAEVINLSRMREDFPNTQQIFLEQNYRSTASILRSCLAIIAEDNTRIPKSLHTTHPLGASPFLGRFDTEKEESDFIAYEIKRCVANMGDVLKWGDFVILLRFNALSRPIESALQKQGIPCRILGGHKFFERMEIKDLLAYLQLVDNPSFNPAFIRAVKVPARGAGDKSLSEISSQAERLKIPQLELVEKIHDNKIPDTKPPVKRKLASFVKTIRAMRKLDEEKTSPSEMIQKLVGMINYEDYLKKTQQDWDSRWENVQELITFATEVETEAARQDPGRAEGGADGQVEQSKLRVFLQSSMLSSEGDNQTEEESKEKVTISTCHAAKGLEWPVVIIPSVDQDTFPFYRTEDIDEERRLLYVACTRAQTLLYVLHSLRRQVAGKTKEKKLSEFVSTAKGKNEGLFSHDVPRFLPADRAVISQVLGRRIPDEAEVERRITELELSGDRVQPTYRTADGGMATVSLAGVKSSIVEVPTGQVSLAAVYAAPDALAAISAAFMKDYKRKAPFSKNSNPFVKPVSFNNSFEPASSRTYSHCIGSGVTYFSNPDADESDLDVESPAGISGSSRQGSNVVHPEHRPARQTLDNLQSSGSSSSQASLSVNKMSTASAVASLPERVFHLHPSIVVGSTPPPSSKPSAQNHTAHTDQDSLRVSRRRINEAQSSESQIIQRYDQNNPPGQCSSRPKYLASSKASIVSQTSASYDMTSVKSTTSTIIPPPLELLHDGRPCLVSGLPSVINTPPRTDASQSSQSTPLSVPQIAGVKRRLGMGRTTVGYSNKKFKPPV